MSAIYVRGHPDFDFCLFFVFVCLFVFVYLFVCVFHSFTAVTLAKKAGTLSPLKILRQQNRTTTTKMRKEKEFRKPFKA